jgi:hypothetical protein
LAWTTEACKKHGNDPAKSLSVQFLFDCSRRIRPEKNEYVTGFELGSCSGFLIHDYCKNENSAEESDQPGLGKRRYRLPVFAAHAYPYHQRKKQKCTDKCRIEKQAAHPREKHREVFKDALKHDEAASINQVLQLWQKKAKAGFLN